MKFRFVEETSISGTSYSTEVFGERTGRWHYVSGSVSCDKDLAYKYFTNLVASDSLEPTRKILEVSQP